MRRTNMGLLQHRWIVAGALLALHSTLFTLSIIPHQAHSASQLPASDEWDRAQKVLQDFILNEFEVAGAKPLSKKELHSLLDSIIQTHSSKNLSDVDLLKILKQKLEVALSQDVKSRESLELLAESPSWSELKSIVVWLSQAQGLKAKEEHSKDENSKQARGAGGSGGKLTSKGAPSSRGQSKSLVSQLNNSKVAAGSLSYKLLKQEGGSLGGDEGLRRDPSKEILDFPDLRTAPSPVTDSNSIGIVAPPVASFSPVSTPAPSIESLDTAAKGSSASNDRSYAQNGAQNPSPHHLGTPSPQKRELTASPTQKTNEFPSSGNRSFASNSEEQTKNFTPSPVQQPPPQSNHGQQERLNELENKKEELKAARRDSWTKSSGLQGIDSEIKHANDEIKKIKRSLHSSEKSSRTVKHNKDVTPPPPLQPKKNLCVASTLDEKQRTWNRLIELAAENSRITKVGFSKRTREIASTDSVSYGRNATHSLWFWQSYKSRKENEDLDPKAELKKTCKSESDSSRAVCESLHFEYLLRPFISSSTQNSFNVTGDFPQFCSNSSTNDDSSARLILQFEKSLRGLARECGNSFVKTVSAMMQSRQAEQTGTQRALAFIENLDLEGFSKDPKEPKLQSQLQSLQEIQTLLYGNPVQPSANTKMVNALDVARKLFKTGESSAEVCSNINKIYTYISLSIMHSAFAFPTETETPKAPEDVKLPRKLSVPKGSHRSS